MDNPLPVAAPFGTVSPRGALPQPIGANPLPVAPMMHDPGPSGSPMAPRMSDPGPGRKSDTPTLDSLLQRGTDGGAMGGGSPITPRAVDPGPMGNPIAPKMIDPGQVPIPPRGINPGPGGGMPVPPIAHDPSPGLIPQVSPYTVSPGTIPMLNQAGVNNSGSFLPGLQQVQNGQNNPWNVNFESVDHNPFDQSGGNAYQGLYGSRS